MQKIAVIAAVLSSWSGVPVIGQAPPATTDVAPAIVAGGGFIDRCAGGTVQCCLT